MNINFRKISNKESFDKLVAFLTEDVIRCGGSAGEVVNMHGQLMLVLICKVEWGTILVRQEMTKLEALAWVLDCE